MKIIEDKRPEELQRIEQLLYGYNYEVWLGVFGPADPDISLQSALCTLISKDCELSAATPSSPSSAKSEVLDMLLYEGDIGSGPIDLDSKKPELSALIDKVLERTGLANAVMVSSFSLRKGHPAYPVFWEFAFDIHSNGQRWLLMGSSSD